VSASSSAGSEKHGEVDGQPPVVRRRSEGF
jgi:hypothetical protein